MRHRFHQHALSLLPGRPRTVAAVSGGVDSMALLHLLLASRLIAAERLLVAHFDHGLRPCSERDAHLVATTARRLGVTCHIERWQHGNAGGNLAARARAARYRFLATVAQRFDARHVVTGHHLDDQAETVIERLLRGSGVTGLAGMRAEWPLTAATDITLVRPLLPFSRREIESWCRENGIIWREDPGNRTGISRRSRIRHQTLPQLQEVGDPGVNRRLAATAQRMARADAALTWMLDRYWPNLEVRNLGDAGISLSHAALAALPDELIHRCLHRCHQRLTAAEYPPGSRASAGFIGLVRSKRRHWRMNVHRLELCREENRVTITGLAAGKRP